MPLSAEQYQAARYEREMDERNRPLSDEELDAIMPTTGTTPFVGHLAVKLSMTMSYHSPFNEVNHKCLSHGLVQVLRKASICAVSALSVCVSICSSHLHVCMPAA